MLVVLSSEGDANTVTCHIGLLLAPSLPWLIRPGSLLVIKRWLHVTYKVKQEGSFIRERGRMFTHSFTFYPLIGPLLFILSNGTIFRRGIDYMRSHCIHDYNSDICKLSLETTYF